MNCEYQDKSDTILLDIHYNTYTKEFLDSLIYQYSQSVQISVLQYSCLSAMNVEISQLLALFLSFSIFLINISVHILSIVNLGLCTPTEKLLQPQDLLLFGVEDGKKL